MRRISPKRRQRNAAAQPFRDELLASVSRCEWCGRHSNGLCVHEILRGNGLRQKAMDQLYAVLVLCDECHNLMGGRPWSEQLAILRRSRLYDYDLRRFHELAKRNYPDHDDVILWSLRYAFV